MEHVCLTSLENPFTNHYISPTSSVKIQIVGGDFCFSEQEIARIRGTRGWGTKILVDCPRKDGKTRRAQGLVDKKY